MIHDDLIAKARAAYFRGAKRAGERWPQPNSSYDDTFAHDGHRYVSLCNINGVLAVYRVTRSRLTRVHDENLIAAMLPEMQ